jgi:hypothetical protein
MTCDIEFTTTIESEQIVSLVHDMIQSISLVLNIALNSLISFYVLEKNYTILIYNHVAPDAPLIILQDAPHIQHRQMETLLYNRNLLIPASDTGVRINGIFKVAD